MLGNNHISFKDAQFLIKTPDGNVVKMGEVQTVVARSAEGKSRFATCNTSREGTITLKDAKFGVTENEENLQKLGFTSSEAWNINILYGIEGFKNIKKLVSMGFSPRAAYNIHRTKGTSWKGGKNGR